MVSKNRFRFQDGVTETNHRIEADLLVASGQWWDGLKPQVRDKLWSLLWDHSLQHNARVDRQQVEARAGLISAGGKVRELTDPQRRAWVKAMQPVWRQYESVIDGDVMSAALDSEP